MGVALTEDQARRIIEFGHHLVHWNRAFNLISRRDLDRLYVRHLLDSLSVVPFLQGARIMDLGTGAGLPGIPLAIACATRAFTLIDRSERKIRLVRRVARQLGLENVEAVCGDAATLAPRAGYDVVVTRAVAAPAQAWRMARAAIAPGGRLLVMAWSQCGAAGGATEPVLEDACPEDARIAERHIVAIPGLARTHGLLVVERKPPSNPTDH